MKSRALLGVFALLSAMLLLAGCGTLTPAVLNAIQLSPASPVVLEGSSQQLTASGSYNNGSTQDITSSVSWSSSNPSVATVSPTGMVTAVSGGTATITATSGTVTASVTVTVAALQSITITPSDPTVTHSATQQFTATGNYSNGGTNNLTSSATWTSSDTGVATVNAGGKATTQGAGQTTITATFNGVSASTLLTVNPPVLQSISVTPGNPTITHSASQQFTATGHYSDNTTQDLTSSATWSSSAGTVASIDASGLATSVGAGQTTITATSGSISGSTLLTVNPPAVQAISVTPADPTVTHSATQQFTATGSFTDGSTQDITATVTWTSSNASVATIDASGLATTTGAGQTTITATSGSVSGSTSLTVNPAVLQSITVTPANPTVNHRATPQFTATGSFSDGSTQDITATVTWTSSDGSVATIDGSGLATTQGVGQTTITATSGSISDSTLTVDPPVLQSITVTPPDPTITHSATQQFVATGNFTDGTTQDLTASATWSSSDGAVATIDAAGLATSVGAGQTTITATSGSISGSTLLTVNPPALQSITVTPANPTVTHSATPQFTATGSFSDGSTQDITGSVTWSSSNGAVASIDGSGLATTQGAGQTTITATSGSISGSTLLTVNPPVLQSIAVTPANPSVIHSTTQQFTATGTFSDGSTQDLTSSVNWTSSDNGVATIDGAGLATTQGLGQTTITATSGSVSGSTTLTVNPPPVLQSITVTPANPSIGIGGSQQFTATGNFSDGSTQDLTSSAAWSSSDTGVATIDGTGLATSQGAGQTTITATSGSISGSTTLTVNPAVLQSITVAPANPTVTHSATQQFTATGSFSDGSTQDLTATVTWSSSSTAVATIDGAGLATSQGAGQTTITATSGSVSGSTLLTVNPPVLQSIAVTPTNPTITHSASQQFTATGTFSDGSTQDLTTSVTWSSSDSGVATIDVSGLASSVAAGQTTITATSGSLSGSTLLTVDPPALQSITVTPTDTAIPHDGGQQFTATGSYSDGTTQDLTFTVAWTSSDESVAVIDSFGSAFAVGPGQTTITATLGSVSGATGLTVNPPPVLQSITVTPANPAIAHNGSQQFTATGNYSDGSQQDHTFDVTWSSSDVGVASFDDPFFSPGLATAVAQGQTTITATLGAVSGSTLLTVNAPPTLQSIEVLPANPSISLGTSQQFTATGHLSDGSTQDLTASVTWDSSDTGVATINASGLASSVAAGQTTITATQGAISGSTTLTVTSGNKNSLLNGTYVFQLSEVGDPPYSIGRFVADGAGNLSGVLDINTREFGSGTFAHGIAFVGTYLIGNDGRGTVILDCDPAQPLACDPGTFGTQTFKIAVVDSNKGYIATWDATTDPEPGGDLGWFEKQSGTLALSTGGYAFQIRGNSTMAAVGRVILNSTGGVTGGSIDLDDGFNSGVILTNNSISGGSYSVGADGHGTLSVTLAAPASMTVNFHIYLISANKFVMVGQDTTLSLGDVSLGGVAEKQVGAFSDASINGTFVYQMGSTDGFDGQIGRFSSGGAGGFTAGSRDRNSFGFWTVDDPFTAAFLDPFGNPVSVSAGGRGTAFVDFSAFGFQENWVFYLISTDRAFVMQADAGNGVVGEWAKQNAPSFSGTFAFAIEGFDSGDSTRSGVFTPNGTISITQDASRGGLNSEGESVNTTFTFNGTTGKGTIADPIGGSVNFYMIDANRSFMLQVDDFTVLFGEAQKQSLP